jgi:hypothetical protein
LDEYIRLYGDSTGAGVRAPRKRFRHLVALLPDPVESGRTDDFDSILEGIEEAIAEGGVGGDGDGARISYVRDRSWLPWPGAVSDKGARACWRSQPGVVLYRPTVAPEKNLALALLLVGETPTWGLRREAFEAALRLADEYADPSTEGHYKILGPTFSGTTASLIAVLRHRMLATSNGAAPSLRFDLSSGTATNTEIPGLLEHAPDGIVHGGGRVTYWSATPDDDELVGTMLRYLDRRGGHADAPPCKIVIFSESQTGYGSAVGRPEVGQATRDASDAGYVGNGLCWHGVKFPPNLRAVREAYESVSSGAGGDAGLRAPLGHDTSLPGSELSGQTAAVHDLDLGEVLRELSQKRVRFVGILATDANDIVFVARRIHEQLPDVQLFTIGADMRFLHPNNARFMNGVLVAHASKMRLAEDSSWSTALESETVRNVYLASRHLLTGAPATHGNVVISLINSGALWQVGPDEGAQGEGDARPGIEAVGNGGAIPKAPPRAPVSFAFVAVLSWMVLAGVVALVFAPAVTARRAVAEHFQKAQTIGFLRHRGPLWSLIGPCEHEDLAAQDRLVTASLLSVTLCPPLLMLVSRFARDPKWSTTSTSVAVLAAVTVVVLWWRAYGGWRNADGMTRTVTVAATAVSLIALGLGCGQPREATFNLLSGASPVLPALIALAIFSIAIWCWRVRLRFLDSHRFGVCEKERMFERMKPPIAQAFGEESDASGNALAAVERRVLRVIERPWKFFPAVPATIHLLLLLSIAGPIVIKPPITFEPGWRNILLVALGCLALLPITGNLSRLLATWIAFRRLLVRLATKPGIDALRRLPTHLARPLEAQFAVSGSEITDLAYVLAALRPLSDLGPELAARYAQCTDWLDAELQYEAGAGPADEGEACSRRARLIDGLLQTSSELSRATADCAPSVRGLIDDYVASLVAVFVTRYVRHFRLYIPPLIAGSVLSALMTSLYFLQPARLVTSVVFVWVAGIVLSVFFVYVSLDRDPVISAMGKREAEAVTWNLSLLQRVFTWGVLPLGSLLAAQYPEVAYWISDLFDAMTKGFR